MLQNNRVGKGGNAKYHVRSLPDWQETDFSIPLMDTAIFPTCKKT